tara:strand:+ start:12806 stop:13225 length:420 start_codon:yes stop_codon:yes gene_type:complete
MDNEGLKSSVVRVIGKDGEISSDNLKELKQNSDTIKDVRDKLDSTLEQLKVNIIRSSTHLLIEKIHRGDIESSLKILDNTGDRSVFFDFISILDNLLVLHEEYYQKLDMGCSDIQLLKENLGINDHKLHKVINELYLDN